jgi:hypothetical protein
MVKYPIFDILSRYHIVGQVGTYRDLLARTYHDCTGVTWRHG